jgi:hypothetical protein
MNRRRVKIFKGLFSTALLSISDQKFLMTELEDGDSLTVLMVFGTDFFQESVASKIVCSRYTAHSLHNNSACISTVFTASAWRSGG